MAQSPRLQGRVVCDRIRLDRASDFFLRLVGALDRCPTARCPRAATGCVLTARAQPCLLAQPFHWRGKGTGRCFVALVLRVLLRLVDAYRHLPAARGPCATHGSHVDSGFEAPVFGVIVLRRLVDTMRRRALRVADALPHLSAARGPCAAPACPAFTRARGAVSPHLLRSRLRPRSSCPWCPRRPASC